MLIIEHYEKSKYKQRLYKIFHSIVCIFISSTTLTVHIIQRVHNRFGRMQDLAYFQGGIRDESYKQERKAGFQIQAGAR